MCLNTRIFEVLDTILCCSCSFSIYLCLSLSLSLSLSLFVSVFLSLSLVLCLYQISCVCVCVCVSMQVETTELGHWPVCHCTVNGVIPLYWFLSMWGSKKGEPWRVVLPARDTETQSIRLGPVPHIDPLVVLMLMLGISIYMAPRIYICSDVLQLISNNNENDSIPSGCRLYIDYIY